MTHSARVLTLRTSRSDAQRPLVGQSGQSQLRVGQPTRLPKTVAPMRAARRQPSYPPRPSPARKPDVVLLIRRIGPTNSATHGTRLPLRTLIPPPIDILTPCFFSVTRSRKASVFHASQSAEDPPLVEGLVAREDRVAPALVLRETRCSGHYPADGSRSQLPPWKIEYRGLDPFSRRPSRRFCRRGCVVIQLDFTLVMSAT